MISPVSSYNSNSYLTAFKGKTFINKGDKRLRETLNKRDRQIDQLTNVILKLKREISSLKSENKELSQRFDQEGERFDTSAF